MTVGKAASAAVMAATAAAAMISATAGCGGDQQPTLVAFSGDVTDVTAAAGRMRARMECPPVTHRDLGVMIAPADGAAMIATPSRASFELLSELAEALRLTLAAMRERRCATATLAVEVSVARWMGVALSVGRRLNQAAKPDADDARRAERARTMDAWVALRDDALGDMLRLAAAAKAEPTFAAAAWSVLLDRATWTMDGPEHAEARRALAAEATQLVPRVRNPGAQLRLRAVAAMIAATAAVAHDAPAER